MTNLNWGGIGLSNDFEQDISACQNETWSLRAHRSVHYYPHFKSPNRGTGGTQNGDGSVGDMTPTVYQPSSTQDLPLFYRCSTSLRSFYDVAMKWLRSSIRAVSEPHRSGIEAASEKGRTRLGLGRVLIGTSMPSVLRKLLSRNRYAIACNAVLTHRYYLANAWQTLIQRFKGMDIPQIKHRSSKDVVLFTQQLRGKSGVQKACFVGAFLQPDHSAAEARFIGIDSGFGRISSEACSTAVRELFDCSSTTSRSAVEGQSNSSRRLVEADPKPSRTSVEALPNSSRRIVEAESNACRSQEKNPAFQKGDRTKVELALTQPKTKVELGMNYQTTKDELTTSLARTNNGLAKDTEKHGNGTGEVLKSGGKGTREVLESYQRGTMEVLNGSRSAVSLEADVMPSVPDISSDIVNSVEDLRTNRLILTSFRELCEEFSAKVRSLGVGGKIEQQRGLKEVGGFKSAKTKQEPVDEGPLRYGRGDVLEGLKLSVCLMIFCVFSKALAQSPTQVGAAVKDKQETSAKGLVIGDSLPDWFWELELKVVNHPQKIKTIKLSNYKVQLLVLDFLNTACSPCIKSVDKWNEFQPEYRKEVAVIPIHLYGDNARIAPFAEKRGWKMPIATGNSADTLINQLFYVRPSFGQVWIMDGRLLAIPHNRDVSRALMGKALTRRDLGIEMNDMLTYFDRRYFIKEEE